MDDINSYALNLEMNLVSNADQVLGSVYDVLSNVNDQLKNIASSVSSTLSSAVASAANYFQDFAKSGSDASQSFTKTVSDVDAMSTSLGSIVEDHQQIVDQAQEVLDSNIDINGHLADQQSYWHEILDDIGDAADGLINILTSSTGLNVRLGIAAGMLAAIGLMLAGIREAWSALVQDEERFITVNYRLYGVQRELIAQVNSIVIEYGHLRDVAMEAYSILTGSMRIPSEELDKYVDMMVKLTTTTGISLQVAGDWIRQLRLSGYDMIRIREQLQGYEWAMQAAGATTQEVTNLMNGQLERNVRNVALYGQESVRAADAQERALWAVFRSVGANGDALVKLNTLATSNIAQMSILADEGVKYAMRINAEAGKTIVNYQEMDNLGRIRLGVYAKIREAQDLINSGVADQGEVLANLQASLKAAFGQDVSDEVFNLAQGLDKLNEKGSDLVSIEKLIESTWPNFKEQMAAQDQYAQSMDTLSRAFNSLIDQMKSIYQGVAIALAPVFTMIASIISGPLVSGFKILADIIAAATKALAILVTPILFVIKVIGYLAAGILDAVYNVFKPFITAIDWLYKKLFEGQTQFDWFYKGVQKVGEILGYVLITVFLPVGKMVSVVLKAITFAAASLIGVFMSAWSAITSIAGAFTSLTGITGLVTGLFRGLWSVMTGLFGALKSLVTLAKQPFILMQAVLLPLKALIMTFWLSLNDAFDSLRPVVQGVKDAFSNLWDTIVTGLSPVTETIHGFWIIITDAFGAVIDWISGLFKASDATGEMTNAASTLGSILGYLVSATLIPVKFAFKGIELGINVVTYAISALFSAIQFVASPIINIFNMIGDAFNWLVEKVTGGSDSMSGSLTSLGGVIDTLLFPFNKLGNAISWVVSWFGANGAGLIEESELASEKLNELTAPLQTASNAVSILTQSLQSVVDYLTVLSGDVATQAYNKLSQFTNIDGVKVSSFADDIMMAFADVQDVAPVIVSMYEKIADAIAIGMDKIEHQANRIWDVISPFDVLSTGLGVQMADLLNDDFKKPVQAETINKIQLLAADNKAVVSENDNKETKELVSIMTKIYDKIGEQESTDVSQIIHLLQKWFPKLVDKSPKLATNFNNWGH